MTLSASDSLLHVSAPPHRSTSQLRALLKHNTAQLIDLDLVLDSLAVVQGRPIRGHVAIRVHRPTRFTKAKVRLVGYEEIQHGHTRCTFYQYTVPLANVAPAWDTLLAGSSDADGWAEPKQGTHILPFSLSLPTDGTYGTPKGVFNVHSGVALRYFAMVSLRLKDPLSSTESVAHVYRSCEIWPRLSFESKLTPTSRPLVSESARTVFMGGSGKVRLSVAIHRLYWVAGQRCLVHFRVVNDSHKTVKAASISLVRTTTVFKPLPPRKGITTLDPDECETLTMKKVVAASVLMMGQKCVNGHARAKGWWAGVRPGDTTDFVHHIVLPPDALSVSRVRLLEVEFTLNVSVTTGGLASDIEATLPISVINFLSIDHPSTPTISHFHGRLPAKPQLGRSETWYRKSRFNNEAGETVPGMKYSSADMTVVAQDREPLSPPQDVNGDSSSIYPSESTGTIAQRLNITASLDEIDRIIGTDSRIHNFVTETGQLSGSDSIRSRLALRGPRGPRLASLSGPISAMNPQEESTPRKHPRSNTLPHREQDNMASFKPFLGRQPSITRASSMLVARTGADEDVPGGMRSRSKSEFLTTIAR